MMVCHPKQAILSSLLSHSICWNGQFMILEAFIFGLALHDK